MKAAKALSDLLLLASLSVSLGIWAGRVSVFALYIPDRAVLSALALTLVPVAVTSLSSLSGFLLAAYLLSSQLVGRRPYSRLVRAFYSKYDVFYFGVLFASILLLVYVLAFWPLITRSGQYYLLDVCLLLFTASILSLTSIVLKHLSIFDPRSVAQTALGDFNIRSVEYYGLVSIQHDSLTQETTCALRTMGHAHNLSDPLGAFHDILMEAIEARDRIALHLYMTVLAERLAHLDGVSYQRRFALPPARRGKPLRWMNARLKALLAARLTTTSRLQVTIHALHYIVRRAKNLTQEWCSDDHRQVFLIIIADLVLALSERGGNSLLIEMCLYAMLRICMDYKRIPPGGSYEPLKDMFQVAQRLKGAAYDREAALCLKVLSFLDLNTPFISNNKNVQLDHELSRISPEMREYFENQKADLPQAIADRIFARNPWKPLMSPLELPVAQA
jgi:hypothetical protein